jgi:hypothetical protein
MLRLQYLLLQQDRERVETYGTNGTPSMVLVRPDGTFCSPLAAAAKPIGALLTATIGGAALSSGHTHPGGRTPATSASVAPPWIEVTMAPKGEEVGNRCLR